MLRVTRPFPPMCCAFASLFLVAAVAGTPPSHVAGTVRILNLHPFRNVSEIPASADLSSIRFERAKLVNVDTRLRAGTNYCTHPESSMYCPSLRAEAPAPAWRLTYSYTAPPMTSDEYGGTQYEFSVWLRPERLSPADRRALASGDRHTTREFFHIATSRAMVPATVIDESASSFCPGYYFEGNWMHTDRDCSDKVFLRTVSVPSEYVAVRVEPDRGYGRQ